jgi:hypothetical protein
MFRCPDPGRCPLAQHRLCDEKFHEPTTKRDWHVCRNIDGSVNERAEQSRWGRLIQKFKQTSVGEGNKFRMLDTRPSWEAVRTTNPTARELVTETANLAKSTPFSSPLNHDAWEKELKTDPDRFGTLMTLDSIRNGANVCYDGPREAMKKPPDNYFSNPEEEKIAIEKYDKDIKLGRTAGWSTTPIYHNCRFSPIKITPKHTDGKITGWRKIMDASAPKGISVNDGIQKIFLRASLWEEALTKIRKAGRGCTLIKRDVESAFQLIAIRLQDRPLHGIHINGKYACETACSFGSRAFPAIWDRVAMRLRWIMEKYDLVACYYVDDFLIIVPKTQSTDEKITLINKICNDLGVPLATAKNEQGTSLVYTGTGIDTVNWKIWIPESRKHSISILLKELMEKKSVTAKEMQRIAGKLQFICRAMPAGKAFLHFIYTSIPHDAKPSTKIPLTTDITIDLRWWHTHLTTWDGVGLISEEEWTRSSEITLETDASSEIGWGIYCNGEWANGKWTPDQLARAKRQTRVSVPWMELYAIVKAATTWGERWRGKKITFLGDCKGLIDGLKKGAVRSDEMAALLRVLANHAVTHKYEWRARWIPGDTNTKADLLSRQENEKFLREYPTANRHALPPSPDPLTDPHYGVRRESC